MEIFYFLSKFVILFFCDFFHFPFFTPYFYIISFIRFQVKCNFLMKFLSRAKFTIV